MMPATSCNKPLRMSPVALNLGLREGPKGIPLYLYTTFLFYLEVTLAFVSSLLVYLCTYVMAYAGAGVIIR
jgi:hypothetical protein